MLPQKGKTELTLSACRPIGTAKQRRINRAELVSTQVLDYDVRLGETSSNSVTYVSKTSDAMQYKPHEQAPQVPKVDKTSIVAANLAFIVVRMTQ